MFPIGNFNLGNIKEELFENMEFGNNGEVGDEVGDEKGVGIPPPSSEAACVSLFTLIPKPFSLTGTFFH